MNLRLGASLIGLALLAASCAPASAATFPTVTPILTPQPIPPPTVSPEPLSRHMLYVVVCRHAAALPWYSPTQEEDFGWHDTLVCSFYSLLPVLAKYLGFLPLHRHRSPVP